MLLYIQTLPVANHATSVCIVSLTLGFSSVDSFDNRSHGRTFTSLVLQNEHQASSSCSSYFLRTCVGRQGSFMAEATTNSRYYGEQVVVKRKVDVNK